jgi:hypothetical protein
MYWIAAITALFLMQGRDVAQAQVYNMPYQASSEISVSSGLLYDNGGAEGNYLDDFKYSQKAKLLSKERRI